MPNHRPRRSKEQITELLQAFRASGMTQSAFASQHGTKQTFLTVLLKKARLQPEKPAPARPAFLEVERPPHSDSLAYRINLGRNLTLEVRSGFPPSELASFWFRAQPTCARVSTALPHWSAPASARNPFPAISECVADHQDLPDRNDGLVPPTLWPVALKEWFYRLAVHPTPPPPENGKSLPAEWGDAVDEESRTLVT